MMTNVSFSSWPVLSVLLWLPMAAGFAVLVFGRDERAVAVKWASLVSSAVTFVISLYVLCKFDATFAGMQFAEKKPWIPLFNVEYALGIDGISLWLVILNTLMTVIVVIASWNAVENRISAYMGSFLVLSGLLTGVFVATDALLFYVFFEATLVPMFLIIGMWGGERRVYAAFKFFLYTFIGSLPMLIAVLYLYMKTGSFAIAAWHAAPLTMTEQTLIFAAFLLAFAVKLPMWPVHTWLPDAHVEAPTAGSVILAAVMLKLGAYGFVRFSLPVTPDACREYAWVVIVLSLIAVVYIGAVTLAQTDMKKLIAYSSISHMGFVTLGCFLFHPMAINGALVQMISHGLISAALFLCIGVLYDRTHTRDISAYGGVVHVMPRYAAFFVVFSLANCAVPGTSGFIGEILVIMGAVKVNFLIGIFCALSLVFGAAYMLWLVKRVIFGPAEKDIVLSLKDVSVREAFLLAVLCVLVIAVGVYPALITDAMQASVSDLVAHIAHSKIPG